jgi:hypothetical protein
MTTFLAGFALGMFFGGPFAMLAIVLVSRKG